MNTVWKEMTYHRWEDGLCDNKQRLHKEYRSENILIDKDEILDQLRDWGIEQEEEWD